jgi:hypothetical protein
VADAAAAAVESAGVGVEGNPNVIGAMVSIERGVDGEASAVELLKDRADRLDRVSLQRAEAAFCHGETHWKA